MKPTDIKSRLFCTVPVLLAFLLVMASSDHGIADERKECLGNVSAQYLSAKKEFQTNLRGLVVDEEPAFTDLADLNLAMQVAFAEIRHRRLIYLLEHAPDQITDDQGLSAFSNFRWKTGDHEALEALDPSYRKQAADVAALKLRNNAHADWPALRKLFRKELFSHPTYLGFVDEMQKQSRVAADLLEECAQ